MELKPHVVWGPGEGLVLQSGPGRDLTFKVTGEDSNGAFDSLWSASHHTVGLPCMSTTCKKRQFMW